MTTLDSWKRFQVAYKRGITVVRLVEKALVKESQIRELARDLLDLIAAGNHRVVLNFQAIERLASWMAFVVDEASRRCARGDGGALKICGLPPQLARMFPIAGVGLRVSLHDDEAAAIESPWPQTSGPRPLPVEILRALTLAADILPVRGGSPSDAAEIQKTALSSLESAFFEGTALPALSSGCEVWLRVQVGAAKGRTIAVHGPRFMVGRDRNCHLRLGSAMVSKLHASIERRRPDLRSRPASAARSSTDALCETPRPRSRTATASRSALSFARSSPAATELRPVRSRRSSPLAARGRNRLPALSRGKSADRHSPRRTTRRPSQKSASSTKSSRTSL